MGGFFGSGDRAHRAGGVAQNDNAEPRLIPAGAHGSLDLTGPDGLGSLRVAQIGFGQGREWDKGAPVYRFHETDDTINRLPQQSVAFRNHQVGPIKPARVAPSNPPRDLAPETSNCLPNLAVHEHIRERWVKHASRSPALGKDDLATEVAGNRWGGRAIVVEDHEITATSGDDGLASRCDGARELPRLLQATLHIDEVALQLPQSSKLTFLVHCRSPGYEGGQERLHVRGDGRLEHFLGFRASAGKAIS